MNEKQKFSIWLGVLLAAAMAIYPPWRDKDGTPASYALIFAPPTAIEGRGPVSVDYGRLMVGWAVVGFLTSAAFATNKEEHKSVKESVDSTATKVAAQSSTSTAPTKSSTSTKTVDLPVNAAKISPEKTEKTNTVLFGVESIGEVMVEAADDPDYWESVGAARGSLQVPADRRLQLEVKKKGKVDLTPMDSLYKDLFHSVDLSDSQVDDSQLAHLIYQTSLSEIDLSNTAIRDAGIEHIAKIQSLKKLWLDKTSISHKCLEQLKELKNLQKLSLAGTDIAGSDIDEIRLQLPSSCELTLPNGNIV